MTIKAAVVLALSAGLAFTGPALAQDLGPQVRKLSDGVYVYVGANFQSNAGIILTQDGVVLIDTGQNPIESRKILDIVKKLTPMPVRLLINTEPHPDHTTGHFLFSPPAVIVAAAGAGESMRKREREAPNRIEQLAKHVRRHEDVARGLQVHRASCRIQSEYDALCRRADVRAEIPQGRAQRGGYRHLDAEGAHPVFGLGYPGQPGQHPAAVRHDSRHSRGRQDDEGAQPRARGARPRHSRHGEDFRGHRALLRAVAGARRRDGEGGQVARTRSRPS